MTPEEKFDAAVASALGDRRELVRFLEGVSDAQAAWRPPDGEWSIAEGTEHILITDAWARKTLVEFLEKAKASGNWDTTPSNPQKLSLDQLRRREQGRVDAPEHLFPKGERPLSEMIPLLLPSREDTNKALLPSRAFDLERLVPPNTRYGDQNVYDRMFYMGIHDALHQEQMERVRKTTGYPKAP